MRKGMKKWCFLGLLGTVMTVQAEEMDSLKNVELQDVQVVATRATKKTPMAFTNMNKEQLKAVNYGQDVPYLLSLTPSVTMTSDAGNGIGYTSLRVRGTDPSRINITANGIPMNDAESAQLYWVNMGDFAPVCSRCKFSVVWVPPRTVPVPLVPPSICRRRTSVRNRLWV